MDSTNKLRQRLNLGLAMIWTIILPTCYASSRRKYTCFSMQPDASWLEQFCFSPYMVAVLIYMASNAVKMVLFFVPAITKCIEVSNLRLCLLITWWNKVYSQPLLYWCSAIVCCWLSNFLIRMIGSLLSPAARIICRTRNAREPTFTIEVLSSV